LRVNGKLVGKVVPDALKICLWKNVPLKKGKNQIKVKAVSGNRTLIDVCEWVLTNN